MQWFPAGSPAASHGFQHHPCGGGDRFPRHPACQDRRRRSAGTCPRQTGSNQVQLGNSATTTFAFGAVQDRSDARDKADIRDTQLGLNFITALRPVDYKWDMREDYRTDRNQTLLELTHDGTHKRSRYHHGLIAQEVKAVVEAQGIDFGGYQDHKIKGGDDVLSLGYGELIAPMIKAIQELTARLEAAEAEIAALKG